ncbi:MAG: type IV pilus assembly protein PilM [Spirochaetota bacterium]
MFNFIKSLVGAESYLGVDIGTASIKIAEISMGKVRPKLKNYGFLESHGHLERLNDAIQTNSLKLAEKETAELLKLLLAKLKPGTKYASASVPSFSAFITLIELPKMSETDTAKTVSFQLDQYIPLPVSEVAIEWFKVGEKTDDKGFDKQEILIISIPNEQIKRYQNVFKLAGLQLKSLEVESLSLIRAIAGLDPTPTLLVDIGARSTNMAVSEKGFLKYNYQTDFSGGSLTQAIANGLNINVRRAEELKRQKGLLGGRGDYELSTLIFPFLDVIISETNRARENYDKNNEHKIERVVLSGGGASLLGLDKYFEKQINLPTVVGNPFSKVDYPQAIDPFVKELCPTFSVAIGLGLREFV